MVIDLTTLIEHQTDVDAFDSESEPAFSPRKDKVNVQAAAESDQAIVNIDGFSAEERAM